MITGLHDYLDSHEMGLSDLIGRAVPTCATGSS